MWVCVLIYLLTGVMLMPMSKCKNSVFCIYFFIFFVLGTICGVFCYRLIIVSNAIAVRDYSRAISGSLFEDPLMAAAAALCPYLAVAVVLALPRCRRFVFPYIAVRGFTMSYTAAALWTGECDLCIIILRSFVLLTALYGICRWICCCRGG